MARRHETQSLRNVRDRDLLLNTTHRLEYAQTGEGFLSRISSWIFDPLFYLLRGFALFLVWWQPLRITHVTATFPPYQGGTGDVCYQNARELARRGHEVHVYTAAYPKAAPLEKIDGFSVHSIPASFRLGNTPYTPGILDIKNVDLIHPHYPLIFGSELVWLLAK